MADGAYLLSGLLGIGAVFTGGRLLGRERNGRRAHPSRARENTRELGRVTREDRIAASQINAHCPVMVVRPEKGRSAEHS